MTSGSTSTRVTMTPLFAIIVALVAAPSAHATCTWQWFGVPLISLGDSCSWLVRRRYWPSDPNTLDVYLDSDDVRLCRCANDHCRNRHGHSLTPDIHGVTCNLDFQSSKRCHYGRLHISEPNRDRLQTGRHGYRRILFLRLISNWVCRIIDFPHQQYHRWAPGDRFCSFSLWKCVWQVRLTIPVTALTTSSSVGPPPTSTLTYTASATQTFQSTSSATSAPGGQGLSSGAVGGIVTGIVIAVAACTAFAFYRYKRAGSISSQRFDRHIEIPMGERGPGKYYGEQPVAEPTYTESSEIPSGALRYPV